MKNKWAKKIFAAALAAAMLIPSPVTGLETARAEETRAGNDFIYDVDGESITIQGYLGQEAELTIPDSINGVPVTAIGSSAFYGNDALTSVVIPEGVTSIGYQAFSNCDSLASVVIPEGVVTIGGGAFRGCVSLKDITLPESLTRMGDSFAFENCSSLTSIVIPKNVDAVYDGTFSGCSSLKEVTIPLNVGRIYSNAFQGCSQLTEVYYAGAPGQWNGINIQTGNEPLTSANINYNSSAPSGSGGTGDEGESVGLDQKKTSALQELEDYYGKFNDEDYESAEALALAETVAQARYDIDQATSVTEIDEIVANAKKTLDEIRTKEEKEDERDAVEKAGQSVKNKVLPVLQAYYEEIKGYSSTFQKEMEDCIENGIWAVNHAYGPDEVSKKFEEAKYEIERRIANYETLTGLPAARKEAKEELEHYKITQNRTAGQKTRITAAVQEGKAAIDKAKTKKAVATALQNAKNKIDQILSEASADKGSSDGQKVTPKKTSISGKIKAQKKGFTVKWKKQTQNVDGYEVCYSTKKSFPKKGTVTKKVSKKTTTKLTVKKLKAKKKYYVRIRTYKKVNGKTSYSAWSAKKSVVTLK